MKPVSLLPLIVLALLNFGQEAERKSAKDDTCPGTIYERKEVARPARFRMPVVDVTDEARANLKKGTVLLVAVLCRDGRVTDITVTKSLPYGMTERVVEAVRVMKFIPAEKDGQVVSQRAKMEFQFNIY